MRTSHFILIYIILGTIFLRPVLAEPAPHYQFPDYPVMMHISVASNGSFALIGITLSEYEKIPDYMCPIDSPDTYISCRELSTREYLLFEIGDGLKYINLTGALGKPNFTALSVVSVGEKWYLAGVRYFPPYGFGVYTNVSYTIMEYFPEEERIGRPIHLPQMDSDILFSLPGAMAVGGTVSNDSLVFSFPYANKTYSVPVEAFERYLRLLNFTDSSGLNSESLLKLFRAVPFRGGILLYIPDYGLESYIRQPHFTREYLLIENRSDAYSPVLWVGHTGFVRFPNNASSSRLTAGLFPPLLYYHDGNLYPLLNISLEVDTCTPEGPGWTFTCALPVLKLPSENLARVGGNSSIPRLNIPLNEGRIYISIVHTVPHYSPENFTFVDLCVNRRKILHAEINGSVASMLNMPFPGLFLNINGSWVYGRLSSRGFRNFCVYYWGPAFNETFVYDPAGRTLRPIEESTVEYGSSNEFHAWKANQSAVSFITPSLDITRIPLENLSRCVPSSRAASMLRGVKVGEGILFYYPFYVTGIALEGRGWATVWGDYSSNARTTLEGTCLAFYYSDGRITSALKAETAVVAVPVGNWSVKLVIPYIDTGNALNVSQESPEESTPTQTTPGGEASGVCGPAAIIGFSVIPLILRRKRRG